MNKQGDPVFRSPALMPDRWRNLPAATVGAAIVIIVFVGIAVIATNLLPARAALAQPQPTLYPAPESINTFANAVSEGRATATQDPKSHEISVTYTLEPGTLLEVTAQIQEACDQMQAAIWSQWDGITPKVTIQFYIDSQPPQIGGSCVMSAAAAKSVTQAQQWENVKLVWAFALGHISYVEG